MKFIFLAGGFAGFATTVVTGLWVGRDISLVLRDSAVGCLVGALLFKWFWSVVVKVMRETAELRAAKLNVTPSPSNLKN